MVSLRVLIAFSALIALASSQTFGDGTVGASFEVKCDDTHFAVWFNKTALDGRQDGTNNNRTWQIYFEGQRDDASCTTYSWDVSKNYESYESLLEPGASLPDNVHIGAPVKNCGINVFADATHIIYNTTLIVTYGQNPTAEIGREEYDKYNVMCLRNRTVNEMVNFDVNFRQTGNDAKNTTEDYSFAFTHTDMSDATTSVYKLGDYIKFKMVSNTAQTEVKAVIQRCWTTTDGSANSYTLISDRCTMETGTSWISNPTDAQSIFKTEAFRYLAASGNKIYTQCLVRVCLDSQTSDGCTLCTPFMTEGTEGIEGTGEPEGAEGTGEPEGAEGTGEPEGAEGTEGTDGTDGTDGFDDGFTDGFKRKRRSTEEEEEPSVGQMALIKSPVFYIIERDTPAQGSQDHKENFWSGTKGIVVIILLATLVFVIAAAILKVVFFSTPAVVASPVVAYSNKAMA